MAGTPQQLNWQQKGKDISIELPTGIMTVNFALDTRIVNHLVANSPKVVIFHIEMEGFPEKAYIVDFEGIKSLPSNQSALTIKVGGNTNSNNLEKTFTPLGKFCIARGESHHNRHLSELGWQHGRKYFNIFDSKEVIFKTKLHSEQQAKAEAERKAAKKAAEVAEKPKKKSKLTMCSSCDEVIPSMPVCPYCGAKQ